MNINKYFTISLIISISIIIILYLSNRTKLLGRPIWHEPKRIVDWGLDTPATNKQILDIYSFSHITHGILLFLTFSYLQPYWPKYFNMNIEKAFLISIIIEFLWELFENSDAVIKKYRSRPEYKNYEGDSIINIIGDIICMMLGYYLCYKNKNLAILYVLITEIVLIPYGANLYYLSIGSLINT